MRKSYNYRKILRAFTDEVLTVLELNKLVNFTVNKLREMMRLDWALIMLYNTANEEFRIAASAGASVPQYLLKSKEKLNTYMKKIGNYILWKDPRSKDALRIDIEKNIGRLRTALVIPLVHHKDMIGVLSLGKRRLNKAYTKDDVEVLRVLARTLSIAITNAQLFKELSEAQEQAAQREKMAVIGTLSAGINHEICNPLGIVRGQCEMFLLNIQEGLYKDKSDQELLEKAQDIMKKVINETDRATSITKRLSFFAKPPKGERVANVSIEEELDKVIVLVKRDLELENISIKKDIETDLPFISVDPKQLQEIFFNLIRNAAQSIKAGGKIIIRASNAKNVVNIDIEDTGEGISKSHLRQIFNPFFTTKDPGKGTGLGLFIVKQIVEKNGGHITVESELGKGAVFRLKFSAVNSLIPRPKGRDLL